METRFLGIELFERVESIGRKTIFKLEQSTKSAELFKKTRRQSEYTRQNDSAQTNIFVNNICRQLSERTTRRAD